MLTSEGTQLQQVQKESSEKSKSALVLTEGLG